MNYKQKSKEELRNHTVRRRREEEEKKRNHVGQPSSSLYSQFGENKLRRWNYSSCR
jgi:hypothetical protein